MFHDFIRFGDAIPSYGLTKEQHLRRYIEREYNGEDGRYFYKRVMNIWKRHRPPYNIRGIYGFLNFPDCIDSDIIPIRYYEDIISEYKLSKLIADHNIESIRKLNNLPFVRHYNWKDVNAVWAKFMPTLIEDRNKGCQDYIGWCRFSINKKHIFEEIALDRLFNRDMQKFVRNERYKWNREIWYIGEVFLEM